MLKPADCKGRTVTVSFVDTSIHVTSTERMDATHRRRGIMILAGPPGIGKTTAIAALEAKYPNQVAVMKISTAKASIRIVMQHAVDAMRRIGSGDTGYVYADANQVRKQLEREIQIWAYGKYAILEDQLPTGIPPLTFVFDEAQNLSRGAIEALRYWNDEDRCYAPFPIGLVFVGNNEFALKADRSGQSVISAANADIGLFLRARNITDEAAIAALVKHYSAPRAVRSLRSVLRNIEALRDEANGAPITLKTVQAVLAPA
jgi:DNA transposition AAA+ family ATPase